MSSEEKDIVKSVERSLDILGCFTMEQQTLTIKEITTKLSLPKSTVFRLLNTLKSKNFIEQDPETQKYQLGYKLYDLGNIYADKLDLRKLAYPIMMELSKKTAETVHLNILDMGQRVCIEKVESTHQIRSSIKVGARSSLCFGAAGKVLLAFLPENEIKQAIINEQLSSEQEEILRKDLKKIRDTGFIVTVGDRVIDKTSISAPIFDSTGKVIAGLSLSGPIERLKSKVGCLVEELIAAVELLSLKLGGNYHLSSFASIKEKTWELY
ncbi:IclR family transcriptional regulator [Alkalihalobacillus sp. MEB130]|uniref:IclR family transcriptional regulator n=1 Tax=Alkalihalobacillus sp. MEB130 TaxID=2976704 RepID=UPI0028DFD366|nr:IclR family transcriptional regulator [Alkalihalobacillus sp. MEB130]MDT8858926.1 IclR family transcriptional regulator [Alkalihalobacillus sp. MEB130]